MKNINDYDSTHKLYTNDLDVYYIYDNLGRPPIEVSQKTNDSIQHGYILAELINILGWQLYIEFLHINDIMSIEDYRKIRVCSFDKFKIDTDIMDITTDEAKVR